MIDAHLATLQARIRSEGSEVFIVMGGSPWPAETDLADGADTVIHGRGGMDGVGACHRLRSVDLARRRSRQDHRQCWP
ncbi:MAG: hypothetical protein Q9Q40_04280 [Acidobacteriota bacterium]|nr:hypothetical protein [Acidobacteriota bacterium]